MPEYGRRSRIAGAPIDTIPAAAGQGLVFDGTKWTPAGILGNAGGDLVGLGSSQGVTASLFVKPGADSRNAIQVQALDANQSHDFGPQPYGQGQAWYHAKAGAGTPLDHVLSRIDMGTGGLGNAGGAHFALGLNLPGFDPGISVWVDNNTGPAPADTTALAVGAATVQTAPLAYFEDHNGAELAEVDAAGNLWTKGSGGGTLKHTQWSPTTTSTYTTTSTTTAAADTTNATVAFQAPPSGAVEIQVEFEMQIAILAHGAYISLLNHLSSTAVPGSKGWMPYISAVANDTRTVRLSQRVAGLTPGQTYQWDLAFATDTAGDTVKLFAGGNGTVSPMTMKVTASL